MLKRASSQPRPWARRRRYEPTLAGQDQGAAST
ncbi:MAG: hypothetical protein QOF44_2400, partial [Streptomyces sp.]|nr:hypothetical protein [Streptomyces sp.]